MKRPGGELGRKDGLENSDVEESDAENFKGDDSVITDDDNMRDDFDHLDEGEEMDLE